MQLFTKLSSLDNIEDGETRKIINYTAGDGIVIDENNVISTIDSGATGTDNYNNLSNKPSINGVVLEGNKTSKDLGIDTPTTLFESATGTQSAITLSASNTNYKSIEIIFKNNDNSYQSTGRLYNANGHTIYLISIGVNSSGKSWLKATEVKLNANKITFSNNYSEITLTNGSSVSISHTNTNYITKVIGYNN